MLCGLDNYRRIPALNIVLQGLTMLKTITKVGNSQGLILDTALCELTGLKAGDQVNVTVHDGGAVVITPIRNAAPAEVMNNTIRQTVKDYAKTLRKLA